MRTVLFLALALVLAAPLRATERLSDTTTVHDRYPLAASFTVHQVARRGWIAAAPTWSLISSNLNPIVTNRAARDHYEALVERDREPDATWGLRVVEATRSRVVPPQPYMVWDTPEGVPAARLTFHLAMHPHVEALELVHEGSEVVARWERPDAPPPTPEPTVDCGETGGPRGCVARWDPAPEGHWVQLMTRRAPYLRRWSRRAAPWGGWGEPTIAAGGGGALLHAPHGLVQLELTFTDGFRCAARRVTYRTP